MSAAPARSRVRSPTRDALHLPRGTVAARAVFAARRGVVTVVARRADGRGRLDLMGASWRERVRSLISCLTTSGIAAAPRVPDARPALRGRMSRARRGSGAGGRACVRYFVRQSGILVGRKAAPARAGRSGVGPGRGHELDSRSTRKKFRPGPSFVIGDARRAAPRQRRDPPSRATCTTVVEGGCPARRCRRAVTCRAELSDPAAREDLRQRLRFP